MLFQPSLWGVSRTNGCINEVIYDGFIVASIPTVITFGVFQAPKGVTRLAYNTFPIPSLFFPSPFCLLSIVLGRNSLLNVSRIVDLQAFEVLMVPELEQLKS
jgi:hypothetical protein